MTQQKGQSHLLTYTTAANVLAVCPRTVRRLAAAGKLRTVQVGRAVRITQDELDLFVARNQTRAE